MVRIANVNNLKIVNVKPEGPKKLIRKEAIAGAEHDDEEEHVDEEGDGETHEGMEQEGGHYDDHGEQTEDQDHQYHDGYQAGQYQQRPANRGRPHY